MDLNTLVKYLEANIEDVLPKIIELEQEELSLSSFGHDTNPRSRA